MKRPNIGLEEIKQLTPEIEEYLAKFTADVLEHAEINIKYESYIEKEQAMVDKTLRLEHLPVPTDFDYNKLSAVSIEGRQKLNKIKPTTIAQASRISGVSPSDISVLLIYMGR